MTTEKIAHEVKRHLSDFFARIKRTDKAVGLTVNVLLKKEEELFVAHCLELDIVTTGRTQEEAQKDMVDCIIAQIDHAFSNDNLENLLKPAPSEVWQEFFSCKKDVEEKNHRIKLPPAMKSPQNRSMVPPWLTTKVCRVGGTCYV
jgi:hypothetical protein